MRKKHLVETLAEQHPNMLLRLAFAEQILLSNTSPSTWLFYITNTGRGRWPKLEEKLLESYPWRNSREANRYAEEVIKGRWQKLEAKILTGHVTDHDALCYTRDVVKKRWPALEAHLFRRDGRSRRLMELVDYATIVVQGRWNKLEQEFLSSPRSASVGVLYRYASKVVQGRLPENLHNLMTMKGLEDSGNELLNRYLAAKKYKRVRKPR
jgi:hypothetical protein